MSWILFSASLVAAVFIASSMLFLKIAPILFVLRCLTRSKKSTIPYLTLFGVIVLNVPADILNNLTLFKLLVELGGNAPWQ